MSDPSVSTSAAGAAPTERGREQPSSPDPVPISIWLALGFGVVAAVLSLAMFAARSGAWWWTTGVACAVAITIGLTVGAWQRRAELVRHRNWAVAITTVYAVSAVATTVAATRRHLLWEVLAGAGLGAVIGGAALLVTYDTIRRHTQVIHAQGVAVRAAIGVGAALVLLVWGMSQGGQLLAAEGVLAFTVAILYLYVAASLFSDVDPIWPSVAGLALLVQGILFILTGDGLDLTMGVGILCWLVGLALLKLGFGPFLATLDVSRVRLVATAVAAVTIGGGVALWIGAMASNLLTVVAGFTIVFAGLSCLGLCASRVGLSRGVGWWLAAVGGLVTIVGAVVAHGAVRVLPLTLLASLIVAAIGAWFVFRGEGLVAIMVVGLVIVWGLADRTTGLTPDPNPTATSRILALGDSYISGEGAREYFEGTNDVGARQNECRRAPTAYPYLVAERLGMGLDFFACSGAKTDDLLSEGQMPDSPPEIPGARAQLANLEDFTSPELEAIDLVLVSIGGNDVGFSTIVQACLLPEDCNELEPTWRAHVEDQADNLFDTYEAVAAAVPDGTPVVVVPYPQVLDTSEVCGLGLREEEHQFVVDFINLLDAQIAAAAERAGVIVFTANAQSFAGHLLCDDRPATNHLHLSATAGDWLGRYSPAKWIHGSMHPNPFGHRLVADRLTSFLCHGILDTTEAECAGVPPLETGEAAGVLPSPAITSSDAVAARTAQELLDDGVWIRNELYDTVASLVLPIALLLLGGGLFAFGLVIAERGPRSLRQTRAVPEGAD